MTVEEYLDRASSHEMTEQMAYDLLGVSPDGAGQVAATPAAPLLPAGAARRIRLDAPDVLETLDKYWPPAG